MKKSNQIPVEVLREIIDYDPNSGILTWRVRPPEMFNCKENWRGRVSASWNRKYANKQIITSSLDGRKIVHINLGKRQRTLASRVAWAIFYGEWPSNFVDHIDGDCTNDRISNLRLATLSQNNRNQKVSPRNTSGKIGVTFYKRTGKWRAWISVDKRRESLGYFWNIEDAIEARRLAENKYGFFEATRKSENEFT